MKKKNKLFTEKCGNLKKHVKETYPLAQNFAIFYTPKRD